MLRRIKRKRAVNTVDTLRIPPSESENKPRLPQVLWQLAGAAGLAIALAGAAPAKTSPQEGTIQGRQAAVTHLAPGVSAFTYWMNGADGEVVTLVRLSENGPTQAGTDSRDFVLRFTVVLAPGQTQTISVPGIDWGRPPTIRIRRLGETIEVTSNNIGQHGF
jgi:hypothetical protein